MQNWYLRSKSRYAEYVRFNKVIDNRIAPNIRDMLFSVTQEEKFLWSLLWKRKTMLSVFLITLR